jgi:hypothetical protein
MKMSFTAVPFHQGVGSEIGPTPPAVSPKSTPQTTRWQLTGDPGARFAQCANLTGNRPNRQTVDFRVALRTGYFALAASIRQNSQQQKSLAGLRELETRDHTLRFGV